MKNLKQLAVISPMPAGMLRDELSNVNGFNIDDYKHRIVVIDMGAYNETNAVIFNACKDEVADIKDNLRNYLENSDAYLLVFTDVGYSKDLDGSFEDLGGWGYLV